MTKVEHLTQENNTLRAAFQSTHTALESTQSENKNLKKRLNQYQEAYHSLQHMLQELRRNRFGKKSERVIDPNNPQQSLFDIESSAGAPPENTDEAVEVPAHKRRKKSLKDTSKLPRTIEIIPVSDLDKTCACGTEKQVIRYESKELLHYKPAEIMVIEQRREVVACSKGCEGAIQTAPAPLQILPKAKATEELLAATVVNKFHHRQPLYHLEKYTEMAGLTRETMARWHINLVNPLIPLYNLMKDEIIDYDVASVDATSLQVLKEPGRAAETKSYLYCMRGGPPQRQVVLYAYNAKEHKPFVDNWFEGFAGSIHMDADPFFELLLKDKAVHAANCNAHARRYFEAITKQTKNKKGLAYDAVGFYRELFKVEKIAKQQKMSLQERHDFRLKKSKPILDALKAWLDEHYPDVLPASPLGKAFKYVLNHWEGLTYFLTDGRIEIDNNLTEQEIKPVVIARKNFMFANSVDGAHAICMHMSLIRTALLYKLNIHKYLAAIYKQLPHCQNLVDFEKLLPWNIQL